MRSSAFLAGGFSSAAESGGEEREQQQGDGNDHKYASPRSSAKKREQEAAGRRNRSAAQCREKGCRLLLTAVNKSRTGPLSALPWIRGLGKDKSHLVCSLAHHGVLCLLDQHIETIIIIVAITQAIAR